MTDIIYDSISSTSTPRRRKQAKPRAFKQLQHVNMSSSEDESSKELIENENISSCMNSSSLSPKSESLQSDDPLESSSSSAFQSSSTNQFHESQTHHSKVDHSSHMENEDNMIIMLPTYGDDHFGKESGMVTPCSPTETVASSETTSTSSIDEMQMSYTIGVTEGTPYPCTFCDKAFPRLSYLKRHEQIHSDQMPFRCDYCQRLFKHKRSRDRHVKLHTGDKRYRCCHCESAFSRSDHLKIHMKTHDHMKPFQCAICNRGYNTAAALTSHMQNHKKNNTINANTSVNNGTNNNIGTKNLNVNVNVANNNNINNNNSNDNNNNGNINSSTLNQHESRGNTPTNKVSDLSSNRTSPVGYNSQSHHDHQQQQQLTCGFCGVKCSSLESHIRQAHLHHLLFAGLLQNSFYHPAAAAAAALPNWPTLMPPPPLPPALTPANDLIQLHSSLPNGSSSPPSPKKAKIGKSSSPNSPQHPSSATSQPSLGSLPLLCNQCSPSPAFPDFESFRIHLKSHLISSHHTSHQLVQHQCPYCGDVIATDFESHVLNCHMGTISTQYGCECCNKMFLKPDELQKHLMDIHAHHLYQCSLCREMFDSKVTIQVHFAVKHSNECKIYKCNICGEFWNNEHDFKLHVKLIHFQPNHLSQQTHIGLQFPLFGPKPYFKCKYCPEEFHIEYLLERHLEIEHANQHSQQQINHNKNQISNEKEKSSTNQLSKQQKTTKIIKCELCLSGNFKSISELEHHLKSQHKCNLPINNCGFIGKINNKCNICDEIFVSINELAEHKLKKHCMFGSTSQCLECNANISNKEEYLKHFIEHHNLNKGDANTLSNAMFPVACIVCKQNLMSEVEIDLHARYHCESDTKKRRKLSNEEKSNSDNIHNTKSTNSNIEQQYINNSNSNHDNVKTITMSSDNSLDNNDITSKRYQCIKCQESFTNEEEIKQHVHQHMINEGIIQCKLCDKEFDTPAKLQCHLIEHNFNGGDEYKCHLCKASCNSSQLLQSHMFDEHITERPFSCGQCQQKFWFPTELDNHNMAEHADDDCGDENGCNVDCDNNSDDEQNEERSKGENNEKYKCTECNEIFSKENHLKLHIKQHDHDETKHNHDETKHNHDETKHNHDETKHNHDNHSQFNEKKYPCGVCGKRFLGKQSRKLHYKSIHCC